MQVALEDRLDTVRAATNGELKVRRTAFCVVACKIALAAKGPHDMGPRK